MHRLVNRLLAAFGGQIEQFYARRNAVIRKICQLLRFYTGYGGFEFQWPAAYHAWGAYAAARKFLTPCILTPAGELSANSKVYRANDANIVHSIRNLCGPDPVLSCSSPD